jgi:UDP-N-acetylglucosamine 2-epimerase (non-hydrolysing)
MARLINLSTLPYVLGEGDSLRIGIVLGTRPEIVKLSPIIRECQRLHLDYFILHTGQHYSYSLDRVFFEQLNLPSADWNLEVGSGTHGKQTGEMLAGVEEVLAREGADMVLVEGDTNTVLAGALAAVKLGVQVGHVEAGLRSYDRGMPEEINRVVADHCSDYLFAPTETSQKNLLHEGIDEGKVFTVGNTVVDALEQNLSIANSKSDVLSALGLKERGFVLVTLHRQENVDDKPRFSRLIEALKRIHAEFKVPVVYPIHPRAKKQLATFGLNPDGVRLVDPLDYLGFIQLESKALLVLTDSGGVQEETCVLGVPCVTLRDNTERPETLAVGANVLAGTDPQKVLVAAKASVGKTGWANPFGDGKTASRIMHAVMQAI